MRNIMSPIPLVWSNGIPKLEISHVGISVVAHISEKIFLSKARRNYVYRNRHYCEWARI
jgi:hypothetical protein